MRTSIWRSRIGANPQSRISNQQSSPPPHFALLTRHSPRYAPHKMKRSIFLSTLLVLGTAMAGFAQDEIPVGEFASLTGGSASFGQSSHKGTALAIEEINAAGGINGKKLK